MKVRFLAAQLYRDSRGRDFYKIHYSTPVHKVGETFDTDDGEASLTIIGEKPMHIKATAEGFKSLSKAQAGSMLSLVLSPDPEKPQNNLCVGGEAA